MVFSLNKAINILLCHNSLYHSQFSDSLRASDNVVNKSNSKKLSCVYEIICQKVSFNGCLFKMIWFKRVYIALFL